MSSVQEDSLSGGQLHRCWWIAVAATYLVIAVFGPPWLLTEGLILGGALGLTIWSLHRFASSLGALWRWVVAPPVYLVWAVLLRLLWLVIVVPQLLD